MVAARYATFDSGFGKRVEDGQTTLEDCAEYIEKAGEPKASSAEQEAYEMVLNHYF